MHASVLALSSLAVLVGGRLVAGLQPDALASNPMLMYLPAKATCSSQNLPLKAFLRKMATEKKHLLPSAATTLDDFILELKGSLDHHQLDERAIYHLFGDNSQFHPTCNGLWMEFGVFEGKTINITADFRSRKCSSACPSVFGFDTFTGLPEDWQIDSSHASAWHAGMFSQGGSLPPVVANVNLVKGLFNESLPPFLKQHTIFAGDDSTVSYLHVDCDLYAGAKDIFRHLASRLVVGTVIVFDELINYRNFRDHEVKAFWEYLSLTGTKVVPIGIKGPLPDTAEAVQLDWSSSGAHQDFQSAAFVIAQQNPLQAKNFLSEKRAKFVIEKG